jgi:NAD(P)H-quinone oxidoreductase subunit 5
VALAFYLPLAFLLGIDFGENPVLAAIGAILVIGTTQLIAPALDSAGPFSAMVRAALLALAVTASFFALETGAHLLLGETVPENVARAGIQLAIVGVLLVAFAVVVVNQILEPSRAKSHRRRALAIHLRNGLYANALLDRAVGGLRLAKPQPEPAR